MEQKQGHLFVIEGGDGTGKETQAEMLVAKLKADGHRAVRIDFPRYGNPPEGHPASFSVRKYLQKKEFGFSLGYGPASEVNPYAASLAYALDRFDAAFCQEGRPNMWDLLRDGVHIVSNRYTQSNIGHQAAKVNDREERIKFIKWLTDIEYEMLGLPRPSIVLLLDMNPILARELKAKQRMEQGQSLDAHESNADILDRARVVYLEAAQLFADTWTVIEVGTKAFPATGILAGLHTKEVVHNMIWTKVKKFLE